MLTQLQRFTTFPRAAICHQDQIEFISQAQWDTHLADIALIRTQKALRSFYGVPYIFVFFVKIDVIFIITPYLICIKNFREVVKVFAKSSKLVTL